MSTLEGYPLTSRSLYYVLLYKWNEQRRPEIAYSTTTELQTLAGLESGSTYRWAFAYLSDRGWVKRIRLRNKLTVAFKLLLNCRSVGEPLAQSGRSVTPAQSVKSFLEEKSFQENFSSPREEAQSEEVATDVEEIPVTVSSEVAADIFANRRSNEHVINFFPIKRRIFYG